jgi:uncharacterized alpha-E superfamily protein
LHILYVHILSGAQHPRSVRFCARALRQNIERIGEQPLALGEV